MKRAGRVPNIVTNILMAVIGAIVPILLLEAGVRVLGIAPPYGAVPTIWDKHPYLGWFHIPNSGGRFWNDYMEFDTQVHINSRGLRDDRDVNYEKPPGTFRILVLGDSFAEAIQVDFEETFCRVLERRLNEEYDDVEFEVINGGVGSYGTDQEAVFFAVEGFRYQPDLALLFFFTRNDVVNSYKPLEMQRIGIEEKPFFRLEAGQVVRPDFEEFARRMESGELEKEGGSQEELDAPLYPLGEWLRGKSALYRFLAPYLSDIPITRRTLGKAGFLGGETLFRATRPEVSIVYYTYRSPIEGEWREGWDLTEAIIDGLDDETAKWGTRLAVVVVNAPEQVYPEQWDDFLGKNPELAGESWDLELPNRELAGFLDGAGIPYLDLLPAFRERASGENAPPLHFTHDRHWTKAGHELVAEEVYEFMRAEGLIPEN